MERTDGACANMQRFVSSSLLQLGICGLEAACHLLCLSSDGASDTLCVCVYSFVAAFIAENTFKKLFDSIDADK